MLFIILIIIALILLFASLKGNATTANQAVASPLGDTGNINIISVVGEGDNGLSPIDIGGLSMGVPNAVLQWRSLAEKYASINTILDPEEILAIIWNESTGNPNASNPNDPSWGLMGVTNLIGNAYAGTTGTDLFNPEKNIQAGSKYLAILKNNYSGSNNDWPDAYNVGETKFNQGIRSPNNGGYSQAFFNHLNTLKGLG